MQRESRHILTILAGLGITGLVYFLSLILHLPFFIAVAAIVCLIFIFGKWLNGATSFQPVEEKQPKWYHYLVTIGAVATLGYHSFLIAKTNGDWDAWAIWNFAAKYLSDGNEWQRLQLNIYAHSNYPLCLPSIIAFFNRLFCLHDVKPVAFAVSLIVSICLPMLIYFELYRRPIRTDIHPGGQFLVALVVLLSFAFDLDYFAHAMSQYADTLLGLFFLAAIIASKRKADDKNTILLYSLFLAFCIWTKDEGLLLALVFLAFHFRDLLKKGNILIFLAVMLIPAIEIIYQKTGPTLGSDIITAQKQSLFTYMVQPERYIMIWQSLMHNLTEHFIQLKIAIVVYLILCTISLRFPGRHFLLLVTCMLGYFMVYLITPFDLSWHLMTSQDRLIHQLLPSFMFVIGDDICRKDFFFNWIRKRKTRPTA